MRRDRALPLLAPQQTIGLPPAQALPDTALIVLVADLLEEAATRPGVCIELIHVVSKARGRAERTIMLQGGTGRAQ